MSHLKEPMVINFLVTDITNGDYVLIYPAPYIFTFNANFYGSYAWIPAAAYPSSNVAYYIRNETTDTAIGRMDVYTTGEFFFNSLNSASVFVSANDIITISSPSSASFPANSRFGVSLVGER